MLQLLVRFSVLLIYPPKKEKIETRIVNFISNYYLKYLLDISIGGDRIIKICSLLKTALILSVCL